MSLEQPIIDQMPKSVAPEQPTVSFVADRAPFQVLNSRDVVTIPEKDFPGDPSRILGHPSNPNTVPVTPEAESADWSDVTLYAGQAAVENVVPTVEAINR